MFLHCLIRMETGLPPMILLDEEGGTVSRLGELGSVSPSAMAQGATGDPENAFRVGRMIGQELRAVGVNFNCAPILDCNTNPKNPVIGVRSFGGDPEKVADFGAAYARGLREAGVIACGKHFPGHGDTETDSHLGLPVVNKSLEEIERVELVSFRRAIEEKIDALMTAHVVFPALEPERIPSTVSRKVMTGLLREKMGFEGLIVTDCMEMDAIKRQFGSARGALMALQAGVDMTLICHTETFQREAAELIVEAMQDGRLSDERSAGILPPHCRREAPQGCPASDGPGSDRLPRTPVHCGKHFAAGREGAVRPGRKAPARLGRKHAVLRLQQPGRFLCQRPAGPVRPRTAGKAFRRNLRRASFGRSGLSLLPRPHGGGLSEPPARICPG